MWGLVRAESIAILLDLPGRALSTPFSFSFSLSLSLFFFFFFLGPHLQHMKFPG